MWDSNAPLQLLQSMPRKLTAENLEKLQLVIDADKYKNSLVSGFDLCGMYAPFCRGCKKTSIFPCALAYVNMMQAGGVDIEIDAKPLVSENIANIRQPETAVEEQQPAATENMYYDERPVQPQYPDYGYTQPAGAAEPVSEVAAADAEESVGEVYGQNAFEPATENEIVPPTVTEKRKIRIAVARKKM